MGRRISICRDSWVMFFQEWSRWLSPATSTSGVPVLSASTMPVSRLVAPGPSVASHTPTRPLTLAYASAANTPQRSSFTRLWSMPSRRAAS